MGKKTRPLRGEKENKSEKRQSRVNGTGRCLYRAVPHGTLSVLPSLGHVLGAGGLKTGGGEAAASPRPPGSWGRAPFQEAGSLLPLGTGPQPIID